MSLTVIPAYRVVSKFVRGIEGLPLDQSLDLLDSKVRRYVQYLLSVVHPSFMDLGERAAITQLGDPELEPLLKALDTLDTSSVKGMVEEALARCESVLPRPDLNARIIILPGDGQSRVLVQRMRGVMGFSLGSQAMILFLWPADKWEEWLVYTVAHEYTHLVRNHLFPRGLSGGKLVYLKSQESETLLDAMVAEGMADAFAMELYPDMRSPWTSALSPEEEAHIWPRVRRRLVATDSMEIRRILFGDSDRVPQWTGYALGYRIVEGYLKSHLGIRPATLVGLPAKTIFEGSGFGAMEEVG